MQASVQAPWSPSVVVTTMPTGQPGNAELDHPLTRQYLLPVHTIGNLFQFFSFTM